ncbi:MAG TPA: hypothetical protein VHZ28_01745 [Terracidiphilus sp.]|nr:hypothetical protein [Terracidiphilus sp.]
MRNQSLRVTGDDGTTYFTGYIAGTPMPAYAGLALDGPSYRVEVEAVSDEILLDQAELLAGQGAATETAATLMTTLVSRTGQASLSTQNVNLNAVVSDFVPKPGATWSQNASAIASQARACYRAVDGSLMLSAIPNALHPIDESSGTLELAGLNLMSSNKRAFANDVTVCGAHEPAAYVTEYFQGDGVSVQFDLAEVPYLPPPSKQTPIRELFNEPVIDRRCWGIAGAEEYFALGAGGLTVNGGDGIDGDTLLSWLDQIEIGGTLLLEATGVMLAPGSTGILAGFYVGTGTQSACVAGFQVTAQQGSGSVSIQPILQGAVQGSTYPINSGNQYALRLRVHCNEIERMQATYRASSDAGAIAYGGQANTASARLQFEIQEFVNGVAGMPVIVYDGVIGNIPPACTVVAVSSINLHGTIRALNLTNLGSPWVTSTPPNGTTYTRRMGTTAQAAECHINSSGSLVFYAGVVPEAAEKIAVTYRTVRRASGRAVNEASQQALAAAGMPSTATWIGSVISPVARSSRDCRNAALALVQAASSTSALWRGTYRTTSAIVASDIWPGDALQINAPSAHLNAQLIVRSVMVTYASTYPDVFRYEIEFANDWAEDLAIKTSASVPADAWLPAIANATPLPNLNALEVTALGANTVTVNVGMPAPAGGGFEIRRRDDAFQPGQDTELVMRGSQPTLTFARIAVSDRFYLRMFDGATPPNYSEFSAALILNLPLA